MDEYWIDNMDKSRKKDGKKYRDIEFKWGNELIGTKKPTNQWTTKLSESLVEEIYKDKGIKIWRPKSKEGYRPDFETDSEVIEVKSRTYTTTGTIGEKILGCPFKYAEVPKLFGKPLKIVLMAYEEYEAINNFEIFDDISVEKKEFITFFKSKKIEYMKCSELLKS